jgi:hypothetical protein
LRKEQIKMHACCSFRGATDRQLPDVVHLSFIHQAMDRTELSAAAPSMIDVRSFIFALRGRRRGLRTYTIGNHNQLQKACLLYY